MPRTPSVVVGSAGHAGRRHSEAFADAGWFVMGVEKGGNWRDAIDEAEIVSICTPDNLHAEMTIYALEHGKHVICEKPLTHRMDELEAIEAAAHAADGQTFSTNFPLRHVSTTRNPNIGQPIMIDCGYERGRLKNYLAGWRGQMKGYLPMCGGGIHLVDLVQRQRPGDWKICRNTKSAFRDGPIWFQEATCASPPGIIIRFTINFGFEGQHRTWVKYWTTDGEHMPLDLTDEPYDKSADIRAFIHAVENGLPGNGADAIRANRLCIQMSQCK